MLTCISKAALKKKKKNQQAEIIADIGSSSPHLDITLIWASALNPAVLAQSNLPAKSENVPLK